MSRRRGDGPAERVLTAVLFTDIVDSTVLAGDLGDERWRRVLREHDRIVREQLKRFGGAEMDHAGDGFFAAFPGPAAAVRCACAIVDEVRGLGIEVRAGVHTGESVRMGSKVGGMAVHIGARIAAQAGPGEVLVSATVKELMAGSKVGFDDLGVRPLKGVEGDWRIHAIKREGDLAPRPPSRVLRGPAEDEPGTARRRWGLLVGLAVALAAVAAGAVFLLGREDDPAGPRSSPSAATLYTNGLFKIDPATNRIVGEFGDLAPANPIVRQGTFFWVGAVNGQVAKFDPVSGRTVARVMPEEGFPTPPHLVVFEESLWVVTHGPGTLLVKIDPATNRDTVTSELDYTTTGAVVVDGGFWVSRTGEVRQIDPHSGETLDSIPVGDSLLALEAGEGALWALDLEGRVYRIDLATREIGQVRVEDPLAIAVDAGSLWVTSGAGTLLRYDARTLDREATVQGVGERAYAIDVGAGAVWIGSRDGRIVRVDPATDTVAAVIELGGVAVNIAVTAEDDFVWFGTGRFL